MLTHLSLTIPRQAGGRAIAVLAPPAHDPRRLHLARRHIETGAPGDSENCAVAVCLAEIIRDPDAVIQVRVYGISVLQRGARWWAMVPAGLADFIDAYDEVDNEDALQALATAADLGLLQFRLSWHRGRPPWKPQET